MQTLPLSPPQSATPGLGGMRAGLSNAFGLRDKCDSPSACLANSPPSYSCYHRPEYYPPCLSRWLPCLLPQMVWLSYTVMKHICSVICIILVLNRWGIKIAPVLLLLAGSKTQGYSLNGNRPKHCFKSDKRHMHGVKKILKDIGMKIPDINIKEFGYCW